MTTPTRLATSTRNITFSQTKTSTFSITITRTNIFQPQPQHLTMSTSPTTTTTSHKETKKLLRSEMKSNLSNLTPEALRSQSQTAQNIILDSPQYKSATRIGIYLSMPHSEAQTDLLIRDALSTTTTTTTTKTTAATTTTTAAEFSKMTGNKEKKVFVPYIYSVRNEDQISKKRTMKVMDMLRLETLEEYEGLERDGWGIPMLDGQRVEEKENAMGGRGFALRGDGGGGQVVREREEEEEERGLDLIVVPAVAFDRELNRLGHGAGFYDRFLTRNFGNGKNGKKPFLFGICLAEQIVPDGKLVMEPWDWRVDAVAVGDGTLLT